MRITYRMFDCATSGVPCLQVGWAECIPTFKMQRADCLNVSSLMQVVEFYKSWDLYGALSNFSAHPISMPSRPVSISGALPSAPARQWPSVEHFYQAQKFAGQSLLRPRFIYRGW